MLWEKCEYKISKTRKLLIDHLDLPDHCCVTFIGSNGSGKTSLAKALCGELQLVSGQDPEKLPRLSRISFEQQISLMEDDYQYRNTDTASKNEEKGFTARNVIGHANEEQLLAITDQLRITHLLDEPYRFLSSGEGRKVLIAKAVLSDAEGIILDAPFDGLDVGTRADLMRLIGKLRESGRLIILIVNRFDEIPEFADFLGLISDCELIKVGDHRSVMADLEFEQLRQREKMKNAKMPGIPKDCEREPLPDGPLVVMNDIVVRYGDRNVIDHLTMTVKRGEHWQIVGPNGAGKSTLLSLITGDNQQGYANDLWLFGRKRGSGETIWDIKKNIGYISPDFHLNYRVGCSVINVIISGYFDTIGLYDQPGDEKIALAKEWLKVLGLEGHDHDPFRALSFGQQRLVLIARALVKHPPLLVLDEPLQGLDNVSRLLVKKFVEYLMGQHDTQIMFISHHREDAPAGITNILEFVPREDKPGSFEYRITELKH
jgi:molybdate transport system ATP-binding protein